jgi:hypothetical protein
MTTRPDFKFGDQVIHIGESQKRGVVSRVFRSGGVWCLAFEGEPNWRYAPRYFRRVSLSLAALASPGAFGQAEAPDIGNPNIN